MKLIIFLCLTSLVFTQTVLNKNTCNACTQLKSQSDCTSGKTVPNCEWIAPADTTAATAGKCQLKTTATYVEYCSTLTTGCASELGCAYVDSKCTHFTGCSAYIKTTTAECQAITFECVSDGVSCVPASVCADYKTQTICETTPSISGILKCKWDTTTGACRDYVCSEADSTLTTDAACNDWLPGCITRGKGCWTSPLPTCASYTGDATSCGTYVGSDGNCDLATGATNCQARLCTNAPTTTATDADCVVYQKGCITTGKGCIQATVLPQCSTYQGDNSTCVGYTGSDGVCEGDAGGSQCRARKCENAANTYATDADCGKYKTGCKTTGKGCTSTLGLCSSYQGNQTTCAGFVGTDGYCKGTSTTTSGNCAPKVCEEAPTTNTTDDACNKYQTGCKSTGQGCIKNLASCTTYTGDVTSCASRIGSDGNCTWVSGANCSPRTCSGAASTLNTNANCAKWLTGCVTNGSGCVSTTTCESTIKELSCQGTTNCAWQPICTSNDGCGSFKSIAICAANKGRYFDYYKYTYKADGTTIDTATPIYKFLSCAWRSGSCYQMECSDLTGSYYATDANCNAALTGCISNKKDACITSYDCSKLTGTMETCKGYNAYCTNVTDAVATSACIPRKCADNTEAADTASCNSWLPGCITNGKGCVDYNTQCTSLSGTQTTCNGLFGYSSGTISSFTTVQCYNTDTATATTACIQKLCTQATGKTSDSECSSFLTGCVYNGKDSCVDYNSATCSGFYNGSDGSYCEKVTIKNKAAKYCFGSGNGATCSTRACTDNTTAEDQTTCDSFKTGCILKSNKGCDDYKNVSCSTQQGTITTCPNYFGNVYSVKVRCTKLDTCQDRQCSDVKTPTQASDCTVYKSSCRLLKSGSPCIDANICDSYVVPDNANTDQLKFNYCTSITNISGKLCGFIKGAGTCSDRTCDQFLSTYTTTLTCTTYYAKDTTTGSVACQLASPTCYTPKGDCTYTIDATIYSDDAKKTTYCQLFTNDASKSCTFLTGGSTCSLQDSCEKVITVTSAKVCNDFLDTTGICQKGTNGTGCTTTVEACNTYKTPGTLTDAQKKAFCQSLKVIDDDTKFALGTGKYTSCIWKAGTTCDAIAACEDVPSAVSQADCEAQLTGCYYYNGKCQTKVASGGCPASLPGALNLTNTQIALYCNSIYEDTKGYCKVKDTQDGCETNGLNDCTSITAKPTNWNGVAATFAAYCIEHSSKDKLMLCVDDAGTKCKLGTCEDVPSPTSQGDCDKYLLGCYYLNNKCNTIKKPAAKDDCANTAKVLFGTAIQGATAAQKLAYCQSLSATAATLYCTHDGTSAKCSDAAATCATYTVTAGSELTYCQSKVAVDGVKCSWTTGDTKCRVWDCQDITSPQSQVDCDLSSNGLTCEYYKGYCYNTTAGCTKVPANGAIATEKQTFCEALTSNSKACTYIAGANCADFDASCANYDVAGITTGPQDQLTACNRLKQAASAKCTFAQNTGVTKCAKLDACTTYTVTSGSETTLCPLLKSLTGSYPCKKDPSNAGKCVALTCEDITSGSADCANNASGCLYYQSTCITKKVCGSYTFSGTPTDEFKKTWCLGATDTSSNLCAFDISTKLCRPRSCYDVRYYSDFDCNAYLSGCKTDGTKCVPYTGECNSLNGDEKFCNALTDQSGKEKCTPATTASTSSGSCATRTCYDNVFAQSDGDCNTFMSGCVTRGTGCIPNTASCDQYRGTKANCEAFKQYISTDENGVISYQYCSGDAANTASSACKNRVCADNTSATDDLTCSAYLTGCVSNGAGCIDFTAGCSSYKGTNTQCAKFMGSSGKEYCQGTASDATTSAACRKRLCTDITATSDKDCYNGMKPLKDASGNLGKTACVFDGSGCTDNNKSCSQFKGDVDSCALYTAYVDGPCKATTIGSIKGVCAKRVCTEAPNTLATDTDCKLYHPTCVTTGYGCTTSSSCSSLANQTSCSSRASCTWASQCKLSVQTCSTFTNTSQSQCVNTKVDGKYCAWSETGSLCRNQTCADQPGTIKDHATCQAFSELCTTNGAGCVTMTACSYYTVQSVCLAASTTKDGVSRCGWESNACRPRVCGDKSLTTTAECGTFLSGCQTNGTTCVAAKTCTDFNGNQKYCQKSKAGPCLYVGGICYDYTQCEDAPGKTHPACQDFSPLCTTNGTTCVPITTCEKTSLKASCVVGTDGTCGWLPVGGTNATEKCQKFGACSDAAGITNDICYAYGPKCVSDGTNCIDTATCINYKTATACTNTGTDGICFWNATNNACKLKDCSDATANNTTNDGCASFTVASGSCTTDGTKCIAKSTCSSYVEAGCFSGTDGVCIFALPVGVSTGTKSCRLKACEDIKDGTSNGLCSTAISTKKCVSNGTSCIAKAACTTYTTKSACNGGGVDSAGNDVTCAFTLTDATKPNIGTCKQFSQCSDANNDSAACQTKTGICIWKVTGTTSSCTAYACDTITTGTSCQPVPSFDGLSYTVCNLVNGKCAQADPGTIADNNCYTKSAYTYSWNIATSKCESCVAGSTTPTNNTTNTNNTNTTNNDTTTTYGYLLGAMTLGFLGFMA